MLRATTRAANDFNAASKALQAHQPNLHQARADRATQWLNWSYVLEYAVRAQSLHAQLPDDAPLKTQADALGARMRGLLGNVDDTERPPTAVRLAGLQHYVSCVWQYLRDLRRVSVHLPAAQQAQKRWQELRGRMAEMNVEAQALLPAIGDAACTEYLKRATDWHERTKGWGEQLLTTPPAGALAPERARPNFHTAAARCEAAIAWAEAAVRHAAQSARPGDEVTALAVEISRLRLDATRAQLRGVLENDAPNSLDTRTTAAGLQARADVLEKLLDVRRELRELERQAETEDDPGLRALVADALANYAELEAVTRAAARAAETAAAAAAEAEVRRELIDAPAARQRDLLWLRGRLQKIDRRIDQAFAAPRGMQLLIEGYHRAIAKAEEDAAAGDLPAQPVAAVTAFMEPALPDLERVPDLLEQNRRDDALRLLRRALRREQPLQDLRRTIIGSQRQRLESAKVVMAPDTDLSQAHAAIADADADLARASLQLWTRIVNGAPEIDEALAAFRRAEAQVQAARDRLRRLLRQDLDGEEWQGPPDIF
jgi:hypothetical protein